LADEAYQFENRRRQQLSENLESTHRDLRARQSNLPVSLEPTAKASLPSGIRIARSGMLEVEFASGEELLARWFELV
jgi:hypothetical protein